MIVYMCAHVELQLRPLFQIELILYREALLHLASFGWLPAGRGASHDGYTWFGGCLGW